MENTRIIFRRCIIEYENLSLTARCECSDLDSTQIPNKILFHKIDTNSNTEMLLTQDMITSSNYGSIDEENSESISINLLSILYFKYKTANLPGSKRLVLNVSISGWA